MRPETTKLLEENIGSKLFDINLSNIFLDRSPQAREIKAKINKWGYIRLKRFCTVKETINEMKNPPPEWEEIFVNNIHDNGLIFKLCKELRQLGDSSKIKNKTPYDPAVLLLGIYLKKTKTLIRKDMFTAMLIAALFTITKIWKQPKCPAIDDWIKKMWHVYNGILLRH